MKNGNFKKPFQFGLRRLTPADLRVSTKAVTKPTVAPKPEAKPVIEEAPASIPEPEVAAKEEKPVVAEPEAVVEAPKEVKKEETLLENAGFSARTVKKLAANNITTVEELQKYLETGATLEALDEIGAKFARVIEEELNAWITGTADLSSQETTTQDS